MSLEIDLEPMLLIGRGYEVADGRAQRLPYQLVFSVFLLGDGRARVFGAHGEMSRETLVNLGQALRARGVRTVLMERHGVEREIDLESLLGGEPGRKRKMSKEQQ